MEIIFLPFLLVALVLGVLTTLFLRGQLRKSCNQQQIVRGPRDRIQLLLVQVGLTLALWYFCGGLPGALFAVYAPPHDSSPTGNDFMVALWVWSLQIFLLAAIPGVASVAGFFLIRLLARKS